MRFFAFLVVFALTGCQGKPTNYTSEYLLMHPAELKNEMVNCQETVQAGGDVSPYCEMVSKTMESFFATLVDQQRQPEKFGQRVIKAQEAYGVALTRVELAKRALETKAAASASDSEIKTANAEYEKALAAAASAKTTVDELLVIIGQSSPE